VVHPVNSLVSRAGNVVTGMCIFTWQIISIILYMDFDYRNHSVDVSLLIFVSGESERGMKITVYR